ncbi:hypothetical protein RYH73_25755 [Olivibacter sp. CPCC 100613]|uniref:hypothetical protein n=1 Tax=Olivibacter sp. CPCC 100613 TaxID=3079931 RepID=UPI002FF8A405
MTITRNKIPCFAINLEMRTERRIHVTKEFSNKNEFCFQIFKARLNTIGSLGLLESFYSIIKMADELSYDILLICEDDHTFTTGYNSNLLFSLIESANKLRADVLLGGISWFDCALQVTPELFWLNKFNGTQFMLIFKRFVPTLLEYRYDEDDKLDLVISKLSTNIFTSFPFISHQSYFGYSDATDFLEQNHTDVHKLFLKSEHKLSNLNRVNHFYR